MDRQINITDIRISRITPNNGLIAIANITINNSIHLTSIGIYKKLNSEGFRLTYPTKKSPNKNIFYPINIETSKYIENEIIKEFLKM